MRITRADVLALLIALGAAITGVVVWNHGTVDLGMTLRVVDAAEAWEQGIGAAGGAVLASAADVPVGGCLVVPDAKVVVTQPTKGDFKAFTAVCTHQGCLVETSSDGEIPCPCHASRFSLEDGSPLSGPATAALAPVEISVDGDTITRA